MKGWSPFRLWYVGVLGAEDPPGVPGVLGARDPPEVPGVPVVLVVPVAETPPGVTGAGERGVPGAETPPGVPGASVRGVPVAETIMSGSGTGGHTHNPTPQGRRSVSARCGGNRWACVAPAL